MTCTVVRFTVSGDDQSGPAQSDRRRRGARRGDPAVGLSTVGSGKPYEVVDEHQPNDARLTPTNRSDDRDRGRFRRYCPPSPGSSPTPHADLTSARPRPRRRSDAPTGASRLLRRRARRPRSAAARRAARRAVDERGWQRPLAQARVFADWAALVGADIAAHCRPVSLNEGELRIAAESTAWATQLRLMASALLASLVRELGPERRAQDLHHRADRSELEARRLVGARSARTARHVRLIEPQAVRPWRASTGLGRRTVGDRGASCG